MVSGYRAHVQELRESAGAARSAGEQVSEVRLVAAFDGAGEAMPGSRSASFLDRAGNALGKDVEGWVTSVDAYAEDLDAAADRYSANEDAATRDFDGQAGG